VFTAAVVQALNIDKNNYSVLLIISEVIE